MANHQSSVRFDHREIAVIFSLFIFVSLLMFTVGILVGKGLAQARYEGATQLSHDTKHSDRMPSAEHGAPPPGSLGSSITTDSHPAPHDAKPTENTHAPDAAHSEHGEHHGADTHAAKPELHAEHGAPPSSTVETPEDHHEGDQAKTDLELVPAKPKRELHAGVNVPGKEVDSILKNPKIRGILEDDPHVQRRTASVPGKVPKSFPQGSYTVQVGSYPTQKDALDRVESLKKLGFPYAYFSAKELGEKKETWFRVWLGFFPDSESAKQGGELLQSRGEVKNYLVRQKDNDN